MTSFPPKGCEGVALFIGGERQDPIVISTHHKTSRKTNLKEGEVSIYSVHGSEINLSEKNNLKMISENMSICTQKLKIQNETCELIVVLSELLETLAKETVNTLLGPQPLMTFAKYMELKLKIDSFRV